MVIHLMMPNDRTVEVRFSKERRKKNFDFVSPNLPIVFQVCRTWRDEALKCYTALHGSQADTKRTIYTNFEIDNFYFREPLDTPYRNSIFQADYFAKRFTHKHLVKHVAVSHSALDIQLRKGKQPYIMHFKNLKSVHLVRPMHQPCDRAHCSPCAEMRWGVSNNNNLILLTKNADFCVEHDSCWDSEMQAEMKIEIMDQLTAFNVKDWKMPQISYRFFSFGNIERYRADKVEWEDAYFWMQHAA